MGWDSQRVSCKKPDYVGDDIVYQSALELQPLLALTQDTLSLENKQKEKLYKLLAPKYTV